MTGTEQVKKRIWNWAKRKRREGI